MIISMMREQQQALLGAIAGEVPPLHIKGGALSPEQRIAVYRHNARMTLAGALAAVYPVVKAIVGEAFFATAAQEFIKTHPSTSGDVSHYGKDFAHFLTHYTYARELDYLPDVARLEWARHTALSAADGDALDLASLAKVPAEKQPSICFDVCPSLTLLASPFPIDEIWRVNQPGYVGEMALDWEDSVKHYVVFRPEFEVAIARVDAGRFAFLGAVAGGATLGDATDVAIRQDPQLELGTCLSATVLARMIVAFNC